MAEAYLNEIQKICNVNYYEKHLSGLRSDVIKLHLDLYSYSHEVMESVRCISNCLTYSKGVISQKERFREFVVSLFDNTRGEKLHHEYSAHLDKFTYHTDGIFTIKSSYEGEDDSIYREALLGIGILNNLRRNCHTFKYIFDTINCSPIVNSNSEFGVCLTNGPGYLICEKLSDFTLEDFLQDCTMNEFIQIYFIIIISLRESYNLCKLTLFNLIPTNIILKYSNNKIYSIGGLKVTSEYIPIIHDTNMSYFEYKDTSFHSNSDPIFGIPTNETFPMYDCYLLLISSIYSFRKYKNKNDLSRLLKFFGVKNYKLNIENNLNVKKRFCNNHNDQLDTFISYMMQNFKIKTNNNICSSFDTTLTNELKSFGLTNYESLNFIQFYDIYDRSKKDALKYFSFHDKVKTEMEEISKIVKKLKPKILIERFVRKRAFVGDSYFVNVQRRFYRFLVYYNNYMSLCLHYKAIKFTLKVYKELNLDMNIEGNLSFEEYVKSIKLVVLEHMENISLVKCIVDGDSTMVSQPENVIGNFSWYNFGYSLMTNVLSDFISDIEQL